MYYAVVQKLAAFRPAAVSIHKQPVKNPKIKILVFFSRHIKEILLPVLLNFLCLFYLYLGVDKMDHLLGHTVGPLTIGNKLFKSQFQPPVRRNFPVETEMYVKPKPQNLSWSEEERNENNLIDFALKTRVWK